MSAVTALVRLWHRIQLIAVVAISHWLEFVSLPCHFSFLAANKMGKKRSYDRSAGNHLAKDVEILIQFMTLSDAVFYFNTLTGVSSWVREPGLACRAATQTEQAMLQVLDAQRVPQAVDTPPIPRGPDCSCGTAPNLGYVVKTVRMEHCAACPHWKMWRYGIYGSDRAYWYNDVQGRTTEPID